MTPEQAAAFVNAQVVCAQAEIASMHAENREREVQDHTHAHDCEAFAAVPDKFGLHHNTVLQIFGDANCKAATAIHQRGEVC